MNIMLNIFGTVGKVGVLLPHWKRGVDSSAEVGNRVWILRNRLETNFKFFANKSCKV